MGGQAMTIWIAFTLGWWSNNMMDERLGYDGVKMPYSDWMILAVLTVPISVFGDLIFSYLKRCSDLKDMSNLIPSHGGVLDRLDSLMTHITLMYWFSLQYVRITSQPGYDMNRSHFLQFAGY